MQSARKLASYLSHAALGAVAMAAAVTASACAPDKMPFKDDEEHVFAGGMKVTGHELNLGYQSYTRYCYACHGHEGDGKGPASYGYRPPPRNFTQGSFKFARMRSSDDVPNDEDLIRIVKGGLHGTPMLEWDVPEEELRRILQYIKTFNPKKWEKKKKNGEPVKTLEEWTSPSDPWDGNDAAAVARGRELYHFKAECASCHPAYGGRKELYELSVAAAKREPGMFKAMSGFRDDFHGSQAKDSTDYAVRLLPPDFTFNQVRSARTGRELEDLFRILSFGVYPIMPAWQGAIEDKDIWAIAHYVKSLMDKRDTRAAMTMRIEQSQDPTFQVPKPEEPKPEPAATEPDKKDEKADDKKKGDDKKADDKKVEQKKPDEKKAP